MPDAPNGRSVSRRTRGDEYTEVEVPWGHVPCPECKGNGNLTRYERGWRSLAPDPDLDVLEACLICQGEGYVEQAVADNLRNRGLR